MKAMARCIARDIDCAAACQSRPARWRAAAARWAPARICDECAAECAKHDHDHCQACAAACRRCAEVCRKMAAGN